MKEHPSNAAAFFLSCFNLFLSIMMLWSFQDTYKVPGIQAKIEQLKSVDNVIWSTIDKHKHRMNGNAYIKQPKGAP